jgi:hypothetical protein
MGAAMTGRTEVANIERPGVVVMVPLRIRSIAVLAWALLREPVVRLATHAALLRIIPEAGIAATVIGE